MKNKGLYIICAILMVILGLSDALRGIFTPLFTEVFGFSMSQVGFIVSASYLGNLVCLLFGGVILDKIGRKKAMAIFVVALAISELILLARLLPCAGNFYASQYDDESSFRFILRDKEPDASERAILPSGNRNRRIPVHTLQILL